MIILHLASTYWATFSVIFAFSLLIWRLGLAFCEFMPYNRDAMTTTSKLPITTVVKTSTMEAQFWVKQPDGETKTFCESDYNGDRNLAFAAAKAWSETGYFEHETVLTWWQSVSSDDRAIMRREYNAIINSFDNTDNLPSLMYWAHSNF